MYFLEGSYLHHSTYFVSLYPYKEVILIKKLIARINTIPINKQNIPQQEFCLTPETFNQIKKLPEKELKPLYGVKRLEKQSDKIS